MHLHLQRELIMVAATAAETAQMLPMAHELQALAMAQTKTPAQRL